MSKRNVKIIINTDQPLGEVVSELDRLGLIYDEMCSGISEPNVIGVWFEDGTYCTYGTTESLYNFELVTLTQLKEME